SLIKDLLFSTIRGMEVTERVTVALLAWRADNAVQLVSAHKDGTLDEQLPTLIVEPKGTELPILLTSMRAALSHLLVVTSTLERFQNLQDESSSTHREFRRALDTADRSLKAAERDLNK